MNFRLKRYRKYLLCLIFSFTLWLFYSKSANLMEVNQEKILLGNVKRKTDDIPYKLVTPSVQQS